MTHMTLLSILAVLMMAVGAGFIYTVVRENERPLPQGGLQWAATVLSSLLIVFSGFLLVLTLVPRDWSAAEAGTDPRKDELDRPAPDFSFRLVEDETEQQLGRYAGKVVLLNFWATWCAPCLEELPDLNRLQQNYADDGLVVLTLSDETREVLLAFEKTMPLKTVRGFLTDPGGLPQPFRRTLAVRPTTYVVDREGYLRRFVKGAGDYALFEQMVRPYLQDDLATR